MTDRLKEIEERAARATPRTVKSNVERIDHGDGSITYEINDEHHLVAFYETNHKKPMKAKFNAELYANAREDIPYLLEELRKRDALLAVAREALEEMTKPPYKDSDIHSLNSWMRGRAVAVLRQLGEVHDVSKPG